MNHDPNVKMLTPEESARLLYLETKALTYLKTKDRTYELTSEEKTELNDIVRLKIQLSRPQR
jgi:hypothetical protein